MLILHDDLTVSDFMQVGIFTVESSDPFPLETGFEALHLELITQPEGGIV
jgi:hypothetical protein